MYELINNAPMEIREYSGQRVLTFRDIDRVHQRADGTAKRNFNANKKYFIEGIDFFKITPYEFRTAIGEMDERQQNDITLVTESGYLMIVKSFTDELAWAVQRQLVNSYFRAREQDNAYLELLRKYSELESRLSRLESQNVIRLTAESSPQERQKNALYVMKRLEQDGGTIFTKGRILRLCRILRAGQLTEALYLLAENGCISYSKVQMCERGKPTEIIEILKHFEK